ncbi:MAG: hypothetical protein IKW06_06045 [Clostridia bacterium]|nr:hypothetical protein [Clostridia bacterium]
MQKIKQYIALMLLLVMILPGSSAFAETATIEDSFENAAIENRDTSTTNSKNEKIRQRLEATTLTPYKGSIIEDEKPDSTYSLNTSTREENSDNEIGTSRSGYSKIPSTETVAERAVMQEAAVMSTSLSSSNYESIISPSFKNGVNHPHLGGRSENEYVSPFDGTLQLNYTDLHLPGRNGLDLTLSRFYKSEHDGAEISNSGGEFVVNPTTYYNKRYALGIGWSFGFPSVEVREKYDGTLQAFYHDGKGSSYRSNYNDSEKNEEGNEYYNGHWIYYSNLDNYYTDNVKFKERDRSYTRGEYRSEYSFKAADDTMQYFGKDGQILSIQDRFNNEIKFDYTYLPGENIIPFYSHAKYSYGTSWSYSSQQITFNPHSTRRSTEAKTQLVDIDEDDDEYYVSLMYQAEDALNTFDGSFNVYCDLYQNSNLLESVLIVTETPTVYNEGIKLEGEFSISELDLDAVPNRARLRIEMVRSRYTIYFTDLRLSPKIPLISKITDTIGRTAVFDYQGDVYTRYAEGSPDLPLIVTVYEPNGTQIQKLTYYRNRYTFYVDDYDGNTLEEHRMYVFWGCNNGLYSTWVNYEKKEGRGSTIYSNDTVDKSFSFSRNIVSLAQNWHSDVYFEYEDVTKWTDNRPLGSTSTATTSNTGFIETWRVASKYVVNSPISETENPQYNKYTYNYTSGRYRDETGYSMKSRLPDGPGYLDPDFGVYRVEVTNPNGSVEAYEYTSHTFGMGYRRRWKIVLPLLDRKIVTESTTSGADEIIEEYSYKDDYAITSPTQIKTTETLDGTARVYYTKTEYDADSCLPILTSLPLTEAEAKLDQIPTKKQITTDYQGLGNRTFIPKKQTYYQKEDGPLLSASYNLDSLGRITSAVDAQGNITYYEYDTTYTWLPTRIYFSDPENNGDDSRIAETQYAYTDAYGLGATEERIKYADGSYAVTRYTYEPKYGNIIQSVDAMGNTTDYRYDSHGRICDVYYPSYKSENGLVKKHDAYSYYEWTDYNNYEVYEIRKYTYSGSSLVMRECAYYDDVGNLLRKRNLPTYGKALEEKYIYDSASHVVGYQNWTDFDTETNTQSYTYDGFDRITSVTDKMGNAQKATYKSLSNEYSFVPAGSSAAENHYIENYDMYGNKIAESVYPNGLSSSPLTTAYQYDLVGNVIQVTDANGKITKTEYDALNNPISILQPDGNKIMYHYTKWGTVGTTTRYDGDQPYNITQTHDDRGLATSHRQTGLAIQTKPWYYEYNADGSQSQSCSPGGNQTNLSYDGMGNLIQQETEHLLYMIRYSPYGPVDDIIKCENHYATDVIDYTYNKLGWLVSKDRNRAITTYTYNDMGNLASMTSPGGLQRTYVRDELERLSAIQVDNKNFVYEYYGDGLIKKLTYPGGMTTEYTYDNANRLQTMVTKKGTTVLKTYSYTYDGVGNILTVSGSENKVYTYDDLYRLKTVKENGVTTAYSYDNRNNLISETRPGYSKTYEYSGDNRLYKVTENDIVTTYEYDLNGNLIKRGDDEFGYDVIDKLIYAKVNGVVTTYEVGADNLRMSKTTEGTTTTYQLDENGNVICENNNEIIAGHKPLAKKIDGTYYYYVYNGHGDVVLVVNENGNVQNSYTYDAWGKVLNQSETVDNSLLYAGEYFDEETGLIYLRNRYYDPNARRFITEDPARDELNWYAYCGNNPVNCVDPWGLYYLERDAGGRIYAYIQKGDTLSGIATSEVNDANAYTKMNYAGDPNVIKVGQKIEITGIYNENYPKENTAKNAIIAAEFRPNYSASKPIFTFHANYGTGLAAEVNIAGVGIEIGGKRYYDMTTAFANIPTESLQLSAEVKLTDNLRFGASYTGTINAMTKEHLKNEGYAGIKIGNKIYGLGGMSENDLVIVVGIGGYLGVGGDLELSVNFSEIKRRYFD